MVFHFIFLWSFYMPRRPGEPVHEALAALRRGARRAAAARVWQNRHAWHDPHATQSQAAVAQQHEYDGGTGLPFPPKLRFASFSMGPGGYRER